MALQRAITAQRDFSAGEVDVRMKRSEDDPAFKTGLRQCANFRITDSKKLTNRIGRTALFVGGPRVEQVLMAPGVFFYLEFSNTTIAVIDGAGNLQFVQGGMAWTSATVGQIVWDVFGPSIYICFPGIQPLVLTWDGAVSWLLTTYTVLTIGSQKRAFFYRISPAGITVQPSGRTGSITLTFSANIAVPGMVGTIVRVLGRQVVITLWSAANILTGTVLETLLGSQVLTYSVDPSATYSVGDVIIGSVTGAQAQVGFIDPVGKTLTVQLINSVTTTINRFLSEAFTTSDSVVGPSGALTPTAVSGILNPIATTVWDEEVMNAFRGWPASVTVDQGRLCFMNFPAVPSGIGYSAIGNFSDLYIPFAGVVASNAIFEIAPGKSQILFMVPGQESSEFIFCDNAIYYVPITAQQPLSATTGIAFNKMTGDGCAQNVQPRLVQEAIVYVSAGGSTVRAITATGAYQRPYEVRPLSQLHDHLFKSPIAIAAPAATDPAFPERYVYVLNSDGTLAVGKLKVQDGRVMDSPGWVPMSGVGDVQWVSARAAFVLFTSIYAPGTAAPVTIVELNDASQYLDAAMLYNSAPPTLAPPPGKGPLWWLANGTCTVMDEGTRQLGLYQIDANGFLIPQFIDGENLASPQLIVGQAWTATAEPFVPLPAPGQDVGQRTTKARIARFAAHVSNSTGFLMARLFSGPLRPGGPALGTVMNTFRIPAYVQGDDPTQPPPLREEAQRWRPSGRSFDPRAAIIKDTSGPLDIIEIDLEVSV